MKILKTLKKTIADTNNQLKKTNENLNQLWTIANKALQLAEENNQKLVSIKENNETFKNEIKNEILEEVKGSIPRDFKEQIEEIHKHLNK